MDDKDAEIRLLAAWSAGSFSYTVLLLDDEIPATQFEGHLGKIFSRAGQKSWNVKLADLVSDKGAVSALSGSDCLIMDLTDPGILSSHLPKLNRARTAFEQNIHQPLFLIVRKKHMGDFVRLGPDVLTVSTVLDRTDFIPS